MQPLFEAPYVPNNLHCIAEEAEVHVVNGLVKIKQIQSGGGGLGLEPTGPDSSLWVSLLMSSISSLTAN